jgi:hypothetical protein
MLDISSPTLCLDRHGPPSSSGLDALSGIPPAEPIEPKPPIDGRPPPSPLRVVDPGITNRPAVASQSAS